ncbi:hypothetical protein HOL21_01020 [Candidatus Woesearchaeota archaeon]|jgi:hypothetical protein|nr:hypothetical protein [Candidatus Woesearchaeota archaeon]MBT5396776.1 hypothetical protein [Candidatus Woesearchaeota archaeon]MBT6367664.1 hypothetical protein [Candidatus Woesearchaeota archaeon]MBT7762935.1 hypothetical protein [Candidatus Woesearchaeota archaeon]
MNDIDVEPIQSEGKQEPEGRKIILVTAIIVGLFAILFVSFMFYGNITGSTVVSIDGLHEDNLNNDLDEEEGYVYNGFSFVKADGLWWTDVQAFGKIIRIPLHFGPKEVKSIPMYGQLDPAFNTGMNVYVAIDPDVQNKYYTLALSELSFNMAKGINRYPIGSCIKEHPACDDRTIISCDNTDGKPVLELVIGEEAKIELSGTCMKVTGNEYELVKAIDRVLYKWYGIID